MVDGPISLSIFWPKTLGQRARHEQGHCHDPVFPNNNAGSLLDLVQETQSEQFSSVQ
jgi:hypothetical protein